MGNPQEQLVLTPFLLNFLHEEISNMSIPRKGEAWARVHTITLHVSMLKRVYLRLYVHIMKVSLLCSFLGVRLRVCAKMSMYRYVFVIEVSILWRCPYIYYIERCLYYEGIYLQVPVMEASILWGCPYIQRCLYYEGVYLQVSVMEVSILWECLYHGGVSLWRCLYYTGVSIIQEIK